MGIIFRRTLKCINCGYVYRGKYGGHIISNGEHYSIAQYSCNNCHSIIDLENYSSLRDNTNKYFYPDGTELSYDIVKKTDSDNAAEKDSPKEIPPFCQDCGNHLFKYDINNDEYTYCPNCKQKSLRQQDIHVIACVD